jgi:putative ABC transport system permease protein
VANPQMYKVTDKEGKSLRLPSNGILLPQKLAKAIGAEEGDKIYIKSFLPGKEKKEAVIKGIVMQYLGASAYTNIDNINNVLNEGKDVNSAVIKLENKSAEKDVVDTLKEMSVVSSVQSRTDALNNLLKNLDTMTSVIGVMILLASVLSIAVIYNIATINTFERQRELATLKVLGFKANEVRRLIFNENYLITLFGLLIGLPLGNWLGVSIMAAFETDAYTIPFIVGRETFLLAAAFMIGFTLLANFTLRKKIRNIDMVEVLKSNE